MAAAANWKISTVEAKPDAKVRPKAKQKPDAKFRIHSQGRANRPRTLTTKPTPKPTGQFSTYGKIRRNQTLLPKHEAPAAAEAAVLRLSLDKQFVGEEESKNGRKPLKPANDCPNKSLLNMDGVF